VGSRLGHEVCIFCFGISVELNLYCLLIYGVCEASFGEDVLGFWCGGFGFGW